ncbi:hypothetical protein A4R26_07065 [Niastella populi]|uniref:Uncharacterized protein n=1 Tax=Niastella populi TaxID=550983 RepID=A0A1V9F5N4_9BACT|nr:hypothetical protein A4R26_07065 [Niastella populi]
MGSRLTISNLAYNMHCSTMMNSGKKTGRQLLLVALLLVAFSYISSAQRITYSLAEREDSRRTDFEIIGKIGANVLVFKNNRNENAISVYNNDMKLLERVKLEYVDDRWINVDFIPYSDHVWMIYQFQRRSIVYCMGVKLDANAKRMSEPIELDTTRIGWAASNKLYSTIYSDDKQKIMVFKINNKNPKSFLFTTMLFNNSFELQNKHHMNMAMEERNDYFTDFLLDNDGDMVFGKFVRKNGSDYISKLQLITKKAGEERFTVRDLNKKEDRVLDEVKVKVDNTNRRYLFSALYYKQKRGNVEGLYSVIWDKAADSVMKESMLAFNEDLRKQAKGPDANLRIAFNDYFISDIIIKRDGGYILTAESMYTTSRGGTFNRWDYLYWNNPWSSPLDYSYWSPYYSPWRSPWNRYGGSSATRYHAENIMVLSFDKDETLQWSNVISKTQFDDETDALVSHSLMITGGELHFLFNVYERRTLLLNDHSIAADGKVTRHPTLKNLDRGVEFMPRLGKQVSAGSMIVPCQYRNYLTFAKIEF